MIVSSRTPEGDRNRCAVCGHRVRIEPSPDSLDAPCPRCGHLLWFSTEASKLPTPKARPKRPQGQPTVREPQTQAQRLVKRLLRRAAERLGEPNAAACEALFQVKDPQQAERLLSLLYEAKSWKKLLTAWREEHSEARA